MSKLCFTPQGLFNVLLSKVWEQHGLSLKTCFTKKAARLNSNFINFFSRLLKGPGGGGPEKSFISLPKILTEIFTFDI